MLLKEVWRVRARAVPRVAAAAAAAAAVNEAARVCWGLLGLVWRGVWFPEAAEAERGRVAAMEVVLARTLAEKDSLGETD